MSPSRYTQVLRQQAHRILSNRGVAWDDAMAAHWDASQKSTSQHKLVLCLRDTTEQDCKGTQLQGLGPLSYEAQRGLYLHLRIRRDPQREPLRAINT